MNVSEGCASFSDTSGNLLFYTDGITIWDKTHNPMPNGTGMHGNNSSSQSTIVVPKPGSNYTIFYVFTVDADPGLPVIYHGFEYSEIDMTLNGGNGDVTATKNIHLLDSVSEKVTAVRHGFNGNNFWVITHEWNTNRFFAYEVTPSGVNTTPVISSVGSIHQQGTGGFLTVPSHGYLKASKDGSRLALAIGNPGNKVEIFNFNNINGQVSNPVSIAMRDVYGLEFSPSGQYLYTALSTNPDTIFQFDVNAPNIPITRQIAGVTTPGIIIKSIQIANNGKIYCALGNQNFLSTIDNPDLLAPACGFTLNAVGLTGICKSGLPNFFTSIFLLADYIYADTCLNSATQFTLQYASVPDSVHWSFDDPGSGTSNFSTLTNPQHTFSTTGSFDVSCIVFDLGISDTVVKTITIATPLVNAGPPGSLCAGQQAWISSGNNAADSSIWYNGTLADSILYTGPNLNTVNNVWVDVYQYGCVVRDTVFITSYIYPITNFGVDTTVCGTSYLIEANPTSQTGNTYTWQDNSTLDSFNDTMSGTHTINVIANHNGCMTYDTINVTLSAPLNVYLGRDTIICAGEQVTLGDTTGAVFTGYNWSTSEVTPTITTDTSGMYVLSVSSNGCSDSDTIDVIVNALPVFFLGIDTTICGTSYLLDANPGNTPNQTFLWQNGAVTDTLTAFATGQYNVAVTANHCTAYDTINVTINSAISVHLGADRIVCDGDSTILSDTTGSVFTTYQWSTGEFSSSIIAYAGTYTLTVTSNGCQASDVITVNGNTSPTVNIGPDSTDCGGTTILLDAGFPGATYLWQDGTTTTQTYAATLSGLYIVEVTQSGCTGTDSAQLTFDATPQLFPVTDTTICRGMQVFLDITNAIPGFTFQWSDGYPDPYRIIEDEGTIYATVTAGNCSSTSSYTLHLLDEPDIFLGEDTVLCLGGLWTINASYPSSTYLWQDGTTEPTYTTNYSGNFAVQVTNQCGVDIDSLEIEFEECFCFVAFPNAFTPNHDQKNDNFNFKYDCLAFASDLKIYNRWGMLVFQSSDPDTGWDGTYKGHDAVADVYIYVIEYVGVIDGVIQEEKKRGTFLLYR